MIKHKCECGRILILIDYTIRLEGSLTFRKYSGKCQICKKKINVTDINQDDLIEQEYLY